MLFLTGDDLFFNCSADITALMSLEAGRTTLRDAELARC